MKKSTEHLLRARTEQTAEEFRAKGYKVSLEYPLGDLRLDMYAVKEKQRIAFEFCFAEELKRDQVRIRAIRRRLHEKGITDFRIVVVSWPRNVETEVEGLHDALRDYVIEHCNDQVFGELPGNANIESIADIEVKSIRVSKKGTRVKGAGTVEIDETHGGGEMRDGVNFPVSLPFSFDVVLDKSLKIDHDSAKVIIDTKEYRKEFANA